MKLVTSKTMKQELILKETKQDVSAVALWQWQILIMQDQHIVLGIVAIMEQ